MLLLLLDAMRDSVQMRLYDNVSFVLMRVSFNECIGLGKNTRVHSNSKFASSPTVSIYVYVCASDYTPAATRSF